MPEKTPPETLCVYCKLPIEKWQRPAIQAKNGDQLHVECYVKLDQARTENPKTGDLKS